MKKIKNLIISILILSFALSCTAFAALEPSVSAKAAILMEKETGRILFEKNIDEKMYPASMTKILTALVALDYFDPAALVTVGTEINSVSLDSSKAGHVRGETLTVENLIRGLIIPSGNDTATVVATAVAKKVENNTNLSYEECENIFSKLMNEKAEELGAKNTHFSNPHGYHADDHYTTARDMALIVSAAMDNETIAGIAQEKRFSGNGAGEKLESDSTIVSNDYTWKSHNLLITEGEYYYEFATGMKTGFTNEAGDCVAATAEKDGVKLISVIFNSEDPGRWLDAKDLFEYGFNNYSNIMLQSAENEVENVKLEGHNRLLGDTVVVFIKDDVKYYLSDKEKDEIEVKIKYNEDLISKTDEETKEVYLKAPIEKDQKVGTVEYYLDNEIIAERDLYSGQNVEKRTIINSIKYFFKNIGEKIFTIKGLIITVAVIVVIIIIILLIRLIRGRNSRKRYKYKYKIPRR